MTNAAYLAADAAAQADRELPAFSRSRPVTPPHVLQELDYAAQLFQRADRFVCAELTALEAGGVALDSVLVASARMLFARLRFECQLAAMHAREMPAFTARANSPENLHGKDGDRHA